jgi:hypothetical protein
MSGEEAEPTLSAIARRLRRQSRLGQEACLTRFAFETQARLCVPKKYTKTWSGFLVGRLATGPANMSFPGHLYANTAMDESWCLGGRKQGGRCSLQVTADEDEGGCDHHQLRSQKSTGRLTTESP